MKRSTNGAEVSAKSDSYPKSGENKTVFAIYLGQTIGMNINARKFLCELTDKNTKPEFFLFREISIWNSLILSICDVLL